MDNRHFWMDRRALLGAGGSLLALAACGQGGGRPGRPGEIGDRQADVLIKALQDAPSHGFLPSAFGGPDAFQDGLGRRRLRAAVAAYARAMHGLAIPKAKMSKDWGLKRPAYDADQALDEALAQDRLEDWLKTLPPPQPEYEALRAAYARYLKIGEAGWPRLDGAQSLKPGATGPQVQALRQRLAVEDPQVEAAGPDQPFDQALSEALQRYQVSAGLKPTGRLDKATLAALNVPAKARAAQIRANLERWRWLDRTTPPTRVDVNSAAQTFDYFEDGQPKIHMLAAAGRPGDETPILTSAIDTVVLNPPWRVPDSIADEELFPKEQAHPGYFASHGFVVDPPGESVKLMQKAGPDSALGLVKFQFPNDYAVYLHDTPAKGAFDQSRRSVSHGCVRLAQAVDFAKYLLSREKGWPVQKVDEIIATHDETPVDLPQHVPVRLLYWTAFPAPGGDVAFRPDIYGWDVQTLRLLDAATTGQG
jgi:murein L,D-transpeptidase YcbB/YkuD